MWLLGLVSAACPLWAQYYRTKIYTENEGLPSTAVLSMAQDDLGRMWFACRMGISRYDGSLWRHFSSVDGLPSVTFETIRRDDEGRMWALGGHTSPKLGYFREDRWVPVPLPKIRSDEMEGLGLLIWDGGTARPVIWVRDRGLWVARGETWSLHRVTGGSDDPKIYSVVSHQGELLLATSEGLFLFDGVRFRADVSAGLPDDRRRVTGLAVEGETIWVAGRGWFGRLVNGYYEELGSFDTYQRERLSILPDGEGGLLVGNTIDLFYYDSVLEETMTLGQRRGLAGEGVCDMMIDREGFLWIGGVRGLTKIENRRLLSYNAMAGLLEDEVSAIMHWGGDRILLGHNEGFSIVVGDSVQPIRLTEPAPDKSSEGRIMDLSPGQSGEAWAAASDDGLIRLSDDLTMRQYPPSDPNVAINTVHVDDAGRVWAGGRFGLFRLRDDRLVAETGPFDIGYVRRIVPAQRGGLYIATVSDGVWHYDDQWRGFRSAEKRYNSVYAICEAEGEVWVGTLAGLCRLDERGIVAVSSPRYALRRPVYGLIEDPRGGFWVGTDNGVYFMDGLERPRHFNHDQGLEGVEINRAALSFDRRGHLWVGTDRGMTHISSRELPRQPAPILFISGWASDGTAMPLEPKELPSDTRDLTVHYAAVTMRDDEPVIFTARLEGMEGTFSEPFQSYDRQTRFTNLDPGRHRYHIRARVGTSDWSEVSTSPLLVIRQPYYLRPWFLVLAVGLVIGILYLCFDYLASKRSSRHLEAEIKERTDALVERVEAHRAAESRYQRLSEELEERVRERTAELESTQRDLIESAHYAGMAEIATSVLHNVGNILSSVNTAGYLIREELDKSPLVTLQRANALLAEHLDDLPGFFANDPRAMSLMKLYMALGRRLETEEDSIREHVETLLDRIDTIKNVVAQQHHYTSNIYQTEDLELADMVETSLTILQEGFDTHHVTIHRDYASVPKIRIQKTKLIHTLVNILKNAREALQNNPPEQREIRISIRRERGWVVLEIVDNGMGITPEDLACIFTHGFTTKKDGNGFGLHSCALAMRDMGGDIRARSDGSGTGARFLLRFPLRSSASVEAATMAS